MLVLLQHFWHTQSVPSVSAAFAFGNQKGTCTRPRYRVSTVYSSLAGLPDDGWILLCHAGWIDTGHKCNWLRPLGITGMHPCDWMPHVPMNPWFCLTVAQVHRGSDSVLGPCCIAAGSKAAQLQGITFTRMYPAGQSLNTVEGPDCKFDRCLIPIGSPKPSRMSAKREGQRPGLCQQSIPQPGLGRQSLTGPGLRQKWARSTQSHTGLAMAPQPCVPLTVHAAVPACHRGYRWKCVTASNDHHHSTLAGWATVWAA